MHVFVTGATGWVGSAIVEDLTQAGHRVTALVRNAEKAKSLAASGVTVVEGSLEDAISLRASAYAADAVIHTAFNHDFLSNGFVTFMDSVSLDQKVIATLGEALTGSDRLLLVTTGLSGLPLGATEADLPSPHAPRKSEAAVRALAEKGIRAATMRLAPSVHGTGDHGFVPELIRMARETGVSAYVDEGTNCWSGVHRRDAARLYRLALEGGLTSNVYHAVADEQVPFKAIAEVIGRNLGLPVESRSRQHFGGFATMAAGNMAASSARTRKLTGWTATGPSLLADIAQPVYYET